MKFSDTSANDGILQMIEQTTGLGLATITGDSNLLAYFTALVNLYNRKVLGWIFHADKDWQYDDKNHTKFPIATTTLVADQRDYSLPTANLRIKKVEIMDSGGQYYELTRVSTKSSKFDNQFMQEDAGAPTHYWMMNNSIFIYPKIDSDTVTLAAGLRITIDRDADAFVVGDTTQEPGFVDAYHPILFFGPAMEWAGKNGKKNVYSHCHNAIFGVPRDDNDTGLKRELEKYYSTRDENEPDMIKPNIANYDYE